MDTRTSPIRQRITLLREAMAQAGVQAVLVPSSDPHLSEYLPAHWQGREWLSGFTGSMATLVVTTDRAALFADSRYWVQAAAQLEGTPIELVKINSGTSTVHLDWLAQTMPRGSVVAVDGQVLGLAMAKLLKNALDGAGVQLRTDLDVLNSIWPDRPSLPTQAVYEHVAPQAPLARASKLATLRQAMVQQGATHHFISTVDDIAWLTNLRGSDVTYNPVFIAHLLVDLTGGTLFVGAGKVNANFGQNLGCRRLAGGRLRHRRIKLGGLACGQPIVDRPQTRDARPACQSGHRRGGAGSHQPQHLVEKPQEQSRSRLCARSHGRRRRGDV
jgi:Xaa-Pro aminopeptidase